MGEQPRRAPVISKHLSGPQRRHPQWTPRRSPLITTDGFESYGTLIQRLMGPACVHGQVIKTRRHDRVVRVERRVKIGTATQLKDALVQSEDSERLNTLFVERLNLTIRQGSAYFASLVAVPRSMRRPAPRAR